MNLIPGVLKRLYRRIFEINENVNTLPDVCICENGGDSFLQRLGFSTGLYVNNLPWQGSLKRGLSAKAAGNGKPRMCRDPTTGRRRTSFPISSSPHCRNTVAKLGHNYCELNNDLFSAIWGSALVYIALLSSIIGHTAQFCYMKFANILYTWTPLLAICLLLWESLLPWVFYLIEPQSMLTDDQKAVRAMNLLRTIQYTHPPSCPCHGNPSHHHHHQPSSGLLAHAKRNLQRNYATPVDMSRQKEYAFEMAASSIRFGPGVTKEVGMDFKNMGAKRVCVVTDSVVKNLDAMKQVIEGLTKEGVEFTVFDGCRVEPKDSSWVALPYVSKTC